MGTDTHLYVEIAEAIRRQILAGELAPGDRLPPVRHMAVRWRCTPGTVSRAYRELAGEGLVTARRGRGTRVAARPLAALDPQINWAGLVNRAERFLLESLTAGHTPAEVEAALVLAVARWQELQTPSPAAAGARALSDGAGGGVGDLLSFVGSHDLLIEQVRRMLADRRPELRLSVDYRGSLGGLIALAQDEADVAGVHLWDEESGEYNLPYVERLLPGRRVALVTLAHRQLGLILPPGNPRGIQALADLPRSGVRWVNRQRGSGTRVWLESRFRALGISSQDLPGFEREENTHLAVARAVADGEADAGLGIYAVAAAAGLNFVPLTRERYDLVATERTWARPAFREVLAVLRSRVFRETVDALGGYELEEEVRERWVG